MKGITTAPTYKRKYRRSAGAEMENFVFFLASPTDFTKYWKRMKSSETEAQKTRIKADPEPQKG